MVHRYIDCIILTWCILNRVQAEVDEVLESKSAGINNLDELKKLQYTQQVHFCSLY